MKDIVIVGGGTAGCFSALLFKQRYPHLNVKMIRSTAIGIVGPGEGLTPMINRVLMDLNISEEEFMRETGGTLKTGIKFTNWSKTKPYYFHAFDDLIEDSPNIFGGVQNFNKYYDIALSKDVNIDSINFAAQYSYMNKVTLDNKKSYAFHIDSRKAVAFLEKCAVERGIEIIDGIVEKINNDSRGYIESIDLDNGQSVRCDFVVDASGFRKLILGKHFGVEWISTKKHLPSASAIACIKKINPNEPIPPYTESIALDYGWAWKIPLQHRYGCGYVYSDKYITAEEAEEELKSVLGDDVEVVGRFTFEPGYLKHTVFNNAMAVGLAATFIEPLEATAIDSVVNTLYGFLDYHFKDFLEDKPENTKEFNDFCERANEALTSFIYLHYVTKKTNTEFWSDFTKNFPYPESEVYGLARVMDNLKNKKYDDPCFRPPSWKLSSWITIYAGNELNEDNHQEFDKELFMEYTRIQQKIFSMAQGCVPHKEYLKNI